MKISIPTPCHEDWNKMTPKEQGSFCSSCAKIVIDFTKMKREEIKQYFIEKKEEKTCGRFTVSQVELPNHVSNGKFLPKFAFALYLAFGLTLFSCAQNNNSPHVMCKVAHSYSQNDSLKPHHNDTLVMIDTLINNPMPEPTIMGAAVPVREDFMLGEPAIYIEEEKPLNQKQKTTIKMGDVKVED